MFSIFQGPRYIPEYPAHLSFLHFSLKKRSQPNQEGEIPTSLFVFLQCSNMHDPPSTQSFHLSFLPPSAHQVLPVRRQEEVKGQGKRVGSACRETYVDSTLSSHPRSSGWQAP